MAKFMDSIKINGEINLQSPIIQEDSISNANNFKQLSTPTQNLNAIQQQSIEREVPTHLTIQVEHRKFCLSLEKLDSVCRKKIMNIFEQKQYSLEELLTLFVTTLRDQSAAEQELVNILSLLESKS